MITGYSVALHPLHPAHPLRENLNQCRRYLLHELLKPSILIPRRNTRSMATSSANGTGWFGERYRKIARLAPPLLPERGHVHDHRAIASNSSTRLGPSDRAPDRALGTRAFRQASDREALPAQRPYRGAASALPRRAQWRVAGADCLQRSGPAPEGARALHWLEPASACPPLGVCGQQQPVSGPARAAALPQPRLAGVGAVPEASQRRLGACLGPAGAAGGELRGREPLPGHLLPCLRLRPRTRRAVPGHDKTTRKEPP